MKFYIASSFRNIDAVRSVAEKLKSNGFVLTYDWTSGCASSITELEMIGRNEKQAVMEADFMIILLPAGKGSHVEMGIDLGSGKKVFLYSPDEKVNDLALTSTFYHLSEVCKVIGSIEELVEEVCTQAAFY